MSYTTDLHYSQAVSECKNVFFFICRAQLEPSFLVLEIKKKTSAVIEIEDFVESSSLQAALDTSSARTTGVEGHKI